MRLRCTCDAELEIGADDLIPSDAALVKEWRSAHEVCPAVWRERYNREPHTTDLSANTERHIDFGFTADPSQGDPQ